MQLPRRGFLRLAAAAAAAPIASRNAWAQRYPSRPVRIIVGFSAGGTTDIAARLMGQWLSDRLGQPFIIENRPGAATNIAVEAVVRAPADGYTLLAVTSTNTINTTFYENLSFNFLRDIAMVGGITRSPLVLEVNPAVPVNTVPELIARAKADPGKMSLASFGVGTPSHVGGEMFKMMAGIQMLHVPYRGSAPMVTDLLGGQVDAAFDNLPASIEHIRSGKLRALAVGTAERSPALPNVPTVGEFLAGFEASAWVAVGAPKGVPADIVATLNREINAGLADVKLKERLAELGGSVWLGSAGDFDKLVAEQTERWAGVIRAANIKPN
jgi:tripartite-type tricarboxylate transporter receptor subunit TctC